MDWRLLTNYGSHPGVPPKRTKLRAAYVGRLMLARWKTIETYDTGSPVDSGWSAWGYYEIEWLQAGYGARSGSSFTKTECFFEMAAGVGRPWKLLWIDKITTTAGGAVSYAAEQSQVFVPGTSVSVLYDAADGKRVELYSAAVLIPADGI